MTFTLDDGSLLQMEFIYRPAIQRWSVNIVHPLLELYGYNLCVQPNILRPWRKLIPFGIAISSLNGLDPINVTDLSDGSVSIFVLSAAEVAQVETDILGPIPLVNP